MKTSSDDLNADRCEEFSALGYFIAIVSLPIGMTMGQIFLITVIPIALGMYIQYQFPEIARRLEKVINKLAVGFLVLIIILLVAKEWSRLRSLIVQAGTGVRSPATFTATRLRHR